MELILLCRGSNEFLLIRSLKAVLKDLNVSVSRVLSSLSWGGVSDTRQQSSQTGLDDSQIRRFYHKGF